MFLVFFTTSCGGTFDSVKRGITGQKSTSADEFLVKKKDPLILPPDFEDLPTPDERDTAIDDEVSSFEKSLESSIEETSPSSSSVEELILKKIQRK